MKKQFLVLTLILISAVANAQDFRSFKFGLGLGYAGTSGGSGGVAVYLEPVYRVNDQVLVGFRLEGAVLSK